MSVKHLADSRHIPLELIENKEELQNKFKTFRLANKEEVLTFNELVLELGKLQSDSPFLPSVEPLELVNLVELYIKFSKRALFLKELEAESIPRDILGDYKRLLRFRGGILQYKLKRKQILPFIVFEDKMLVIATSIKVALKAYSETMDKQKNDLNIEYFELKSDKLNINDVFEFFKLILTYICIDNVKFNASSKLMDIQKWLRLLPPEKLKILCQFTPKFPLDWFEAFDRNETEGSCKCDFIVS